ncbi:MAG: dihydroneopterin aldolase [Proteobacteria bacterium]|jgi:7,8-dihydroneopterin aldolase/epimerase/oxygenase|nr:dihydroneopterin aldolase [Pseudomonadota bacterium]
MKDQVLIEGLGVETTIGVYEWERNIKQRVMLDLQFETDISPAAAEDDLKLALDYDAISRRVTSFVSESRFLLIESVAEKTAQLILDEFAVQSLRIKVSKPGAIDNADNVAVLIERTKGS